MLCDVMWCHFMLVQYYAVLQSTALYYKVQRQSYKVLLQYYSILQSTTLYYKVPLQYHSSTTLYYSSTIQSTSLFSHSPRLWLEPSEMFVRKWWFARSILHPPKRTCPLKRVQFSTQFKRKGSSSNHYSSGDMLVFEGNVGFFLSKPPTLKDGKGESTMGNDLKKSIPLRKGDYLLGDFRTLQIVSGQNCHTRVHF